MGVRAWTRPSGFQTHVDSLFHVSAEGRLDSKPYMPPEPERTYSKNDRSAVACVPIASRRVDCRHIKVCVRNLSYC